MHSVSIANQIKERQTITLFVLYLSSFVLLFIAPLAHFGLLLYLFLNMTQSHKLIFQSCFFKFPKQG